MVERNLLNHDPEPISNFKDIHFLYRGINKNLWQKWTDINKIQPQIFTTSNAIEGLSTDWSKYSEPRDTLNRLREPELTKNGIVEINYRELRITIRENNFPISITHDPLPNNRAHTLIQGLTKPNTAKIRKKLSKITNWAPGMKPTIQ